MNVLQITAFIASCSLTFAGEPPVFGGMTENQFAAFLQSNPSQAAAAEAIDAVYLARRTDLLRIATESGNSRFAFWEKFRDEPPSDFRNELVPLFLRMPWRPYDMDGPPEDRLEALSISQGPFINLTKVLTTYISAYLPQEHLIVDDPETQKRFRTREARVELARKFAEAVAVYKGTPLQNTPRPQGDTAAPVPITAKTVQTPGNPAPAIGTSAKSPLFESKRVLGASAVGLLLLTVLVFVLTKHGRR